MIDEITNHLRAAAEAAKCHRCRCFHGAVSALATAELPAALRATIVRARRVMVDAEYDCLGCQVCWPAEAIDAAAPIFGIDPVQVCAAAPAQRRAGWPPLAGDYRINRFAAPVAVCTLHSLELGAEVHRRRPEGLAIVGSLQTENLGIERLVANLVGNPNVRRLVLCGVDSARAVGHLPGQSLAALVENGLDGDRRIIGARGRRPVLPNLDAAVVVRFRRQIELVDRRGMVDAAALARLVTEQAREAPGALDGLPPALRTVEAVAAGAPRPLVADPSGYVVIFVDRERSRLEVEHYQSHGLLDLVIHGTSAVELIATLLDRALVTRLDHAAYLGRELTRAEAALREGNDYIQDRAPDSDPPVERAERLERAAAACCCAADTCCETED